MSESRFSGPEKARKEALLERGYRTREDIRLAVSRLTGGKIHRQSKQPILDSALDGRGVTYTVPSGKIFTLYPYAECVNGAVSIAIQQNLVSEEKAKQLGYPVQPLGGVRRLKIAHMWG